MANTSRVPATLDALVTRLDTDLEVPVYDGVGVSDDDSGSYLLIGVDDPDSEDAPSAATSRFEWRGIGKLSRHEFITVHCAAVAWNGDSGNAALKSARDAAYAILHAAEAALYADASITSSVMFSKLGDATLRQNQNHVGSEAQVVFTIEAEARLSA